MLPALNFLHSVDCKGVNARCCEYAPGDVVAFADNGTLKSISCHDDVSEPQVLVTDDHSVFNALAFSHDGNVILAGDLDGCLKFIKLSEPKTSIAVTLLIDQDQHSKEPIECIVNDGNDKFAVAVGRSIYIVNCDGKVINTLGPLPTPVRDLKWHQHRTHRHEKLQNNSSVPLCLLAVTSTECYIWPIDDDGLYANITTTTKVPIVLPCAQQEKESNLKESSSASPISSSFSSLAVSPNSQYVALNCGNNKREINFWDLNRHLTSILSYSSPSSNGASTENVARAAANTTIEKEKEEPSTVEALTPCLTLPLYDNPVDCLTWDTSGRYLATSDGADCTIWDISHASEVQAVHDADSIMCCGHDPATKITCLAFQPDNGPLLASVSNTGKLALFDSRGFRRGGVSGPFATTYIDLNKMSRKSGSDTSNVGGGGVNEEVEGEREAGGNENEVNVDLGEVKLLWISGNRLLLAIPGRDLVIYSICGGDSNVAGAKSSLIGDENTNQTATYLEHSSSSSTSASFLVDVAASGGESEFNNKKNNNQSERMIHHLSIDNSNKSSPMEQACVEYTSSPLTPHRGSGDLDSLDSSAAGEEGEDELGEEYRNEEKHGVPALQKIDELEEEEIEMALPVPAPIRTRQKSIETQNNHQQQQQQRNTNSTVTGKPPPPPLPAVQPIYTGRPSSGAPATPARPNTNFITSPRRNHNNNTSNHVTHHIPRSPGGSIRLEQRIQQLRDAPPTERGGGHRHPELTGWGLGVNGGVGVGGGVGPPSMPTWIMTPHGGISPVPTPGMALNVPMSVPNRGALMVGAVGGIGGGIGVQRSQQHQQHQLQQQQHAVTMYPSSAMPAGYGPVGVMGSSPPMMQYGQYQYAYPQYYPSHIQGQQQMIMMVPVATPQPGSGAVAVAPPPPGGSAGMPVSHVQMMAALPPHQYQQQQQLHQHQQSQLHQHQQQHLQQPPPPTAPYPGSPSRSAAAVDYSQQNISSPRSPVGGMQQQQQQRQMQSQQWAGIAPGYMTYQHGAVSYGAGAGAAGGGGGGGGAAGGGIVAGTSPRINPASHMPYMNQPPPLNSAPAGPVIQLQSQQQQQHVSLSPRSSGGSRGATMKGNPVCGKESDEVNNGSVVSVTQRGVQTRSLKGESAEESTSKTAGAATTVPTAGSAATPRVQVQLEIERSRSTNFSEETENSIEIHEHNNKNGAAAAAERRESGETSFSPPSSLTPSPRQSHHHNPKQRLSNNSRGVTPPVSPPAAAHSPHPPFYPYLPSSTSAGAGQTTMHMSSSSTQEPSSIIYLGNLPESVDDQTLYWTCAQFGPVVHVQIIRDKKSNTSRGYGFVTFAHPVYATFAMQKMDGQVMYGPFGGQKIKAAPTYKKCLESVGA